MFWLKCEDLYYYDNKEKLEEVLLKLNIKSNLTNLVEKKVFSNEDATIVLKKYSKDSYIISPFEPDFYGFKNVLFTEITIPNYYNILTKHEKEAGITEANKLQKKLDLVVEESKFNFDDMSGGEGIDKIKNTVISLKYKRALGESIKSIFLVGVPGTGKSLFAQCLAGETKRLLVSLNLAKLMHEPNPIASFDMIINFLVSMGGKYILWLDEIEKMFTESEKAEHIKNKFLTVSNDIGQTIDLDVFIVMTANKIEKILKNNPELLRGGRTESNAKFFMDFPTNESALNILNFYKNNFNKKKNKMIGYLLEAYCDNEIPDNNNNKILKIFKENENEILGFISIIDINFNLKREEKAEKLFNLAKNSFLNEDLLKDIYNLQEFDYDFNSFINFTNEYDFSKVNEIKAHTNFPYVPAELKEIATQFYINYIFYREKFNNTKNFFNEIVKNNVPIGESSKEGITIIRENAKNFIIID